MNGRINLDQQVGTTSGIFSPPAANALNQQGYLQSSGGINSSDSIRKQFTHSTKFESGAAADLVKGNLEKNALNTAFFSNENVQIIQNKLQYQVYARSQGKHRIGPQSVENLLIIMRSNYYQYGKNLPYNIKEQIDELNNHVVNFAVPKIIGEIEMYQKYRNDIQNLPLPFQHPTNISRAGTKSAPMPQFF